MSVLNLMHPCSLDVAVCGSIAIAVDLEGVEAVGAFCERLGALGPSAGVVGMRVAD